MRTVTGNHAKDFSCLFTENFNHAKKLQEFVLFIKLFVLTKMEIPQNMLERITRQWIRPCIGVGVRLPTNFYGLEAMEPTKQ